MRFSESDLRRWMAPPSNNEDAKRDRTEDEIRTAINTHPNLRGAVSVYAKGSYKNNTNVRLDYDVDIAVEYTGFRFTEQTGAALNLDPESLGIYPYTGSYTVAKFKDDVEQALVDQFGRSAVKRGNKAMRVREAKTTLPADVVPSFIYEEVYGRSVSGDPLTRRGTRVFPDQGPYIHNWPQQHYDNGVAKNNDTGYRFKRLVRIVKRLENELVKNGLIEEVPSYLVECLVYNVPNDNLGYSAFTSDLRATLAHVFNNTMTDGACKEWIEVNEVKYLFHSSQAWTRAQAHQLVSEAWDFMGYE
jgi:hypothetical protein